MIVLMKFKQLKKNHKKLGKCGEFYIVDATTQPKMSDYHNILTENMVLGTTNMTTSVSGLAFNPTQSILDDTVPVTRRDQLKTNFFMSDEFVSEFMVVLSLQYEKPDENIFICLEDNVYDNMALEFMERFRELLNANSNGLIYLWNDTAGMKEYLDRFIDKKLESYKEKRQSSDDFFDSRYDSHDEKRNRKYRSDFDKEYDLFDDDDDYDFFRDEKKNRGPAKFKTASLDDDENDNYIDYVELKNELGNMESNKEIRMAFLTYAKPSKNKLEKVSAAIERHKRSLTRPD